MKTDPSDKQLIEIGIAVFEQAQEIFEACLASEDFAHQDRLVFGSINRIKLTPRGWEAIRSHCTPDFLRRFERFMNHLEPEGPEMIHLGCHTRDSDGICLECNCMRTHSPECPVPAWEKQEDERFERMIAERGDDGQPADVSEAFEIDVSEAFEINDQELCTSCEHTGYWHANDGCHFRECLCPKFELDNQMK